MAAKRSGMGHDYDSSPTNPSGLVISSTDPILAFLTSASNHPQLNAELREAALDHSSQSAMPYKLLRSIWVASDPSTRPHLLGLFEEFKSLLRKLEELTERKAYKELVKDITPKMDTNEPFSSYKDQLGFGLHLALTMFTGYLVGYAAFRALFSHNPIMNAAGGILGLVFGMILETLLFIIRTSELERKQAAPSGSKLKKNQ